MSHFQKLVFAFNAGLEVKAKIDKATAEWNALADEYGKPISLLAALSPEDKYGPSGYDAIETPADSLRRFIPSNLTLSYTIDFWNKEDATAPAQDVLIVDTLDLDLDFSSFAFTEFGFLKWVVSLDSVQQFNIDVDMRPDDSLMVNVDGSFDPGTGVIT